MRFLDMEPGFQAAFEAAIAAYRRGSTPVGSAIISEKGKCIAMGENSIYAQDHRDLLDGHHLAHAELNAILKINTREHIDFSSYTLYTTMEPCAVCFSAAAMSYFRAVRFASRDRFTGATSLGAVAPLSSRNVQVSGPYEVLEPLQVALIVHRRLALDLPQNDRFLKLYDSYCTQGVALGKALFEDDGFAGLLNSGAPAPQVLDHMLGAMPS